MRPCEHLRNSSAVKAPVNGTDLALFSAEGRGLAFCGGSWVAISGVISGVTRIMTHYDTYYGTYNRTPDCP